MRQNKSATLAATAVMSDVDGMTTVALLCGDFSATSLRDAVEVCLDPDHVLAVLKAAA